ncbi:MAG TPA: glycosyltransferase 87 family protein [Roseiflexaceae bacterium]|nr:glycosyltransferase 87 family protein [Roseiflexaceae bacterium]
MNLHTGVAATIPASRVVFVLVLGLLLALLPPLDYRYFADAARAWRERPTSLYTPAVEQFFYAPWSMLLLGPLSLLPDQLGQALLNLLSLAGLLGGVRALVRPLGRAALVLALATPFAASIVLLGQWDALVLGGVGLGFYGLERRRPWLVGLALVLIGTKPTNALFVGPALLYALRAWPPRDLARVAVLPLAALLGSFALCGLDWPQRYILYLRDSPPAGYNIALWLLPGAPFWLTVLGLGLATALALRIHRHGLDGPALALTLALSQLLSPFLTPYHLVLLAPALAVIAQGSLRAGLWLWAAGLVAFVTTLFGRVPLALDAFLLLVCVLMLVPASLLQGRSAPQSRSK